MENRTKYYLVVESVAVLVVLAITILMLVFRPSLEINSGLFLAFMGGFAVIIFMTFVFAMASKYKLTDMTPGEFFKKAGMMAAGLTILYVGLWLLTLLF
jgi:hypothetical protein